MAINKFTFRTEKPTGSFRSFYPDFHCVKYGKSVVGSIDEARPFRVSLQVLKEDVDKTSNCPWKRITFSKEHESPQAAKDWLNEHFKAITEKYKLYLDNNT